MMRRLVGAFALAVVGATGAQAQFTANFTANNPPGDFDTYNGTFHSSTGNTGVTLGSPFQIFCVDQLHFFNGGDTYNVWVTPMSSSDFSHTRLGANGDLDAKADYLRSASLASLFGTATGNDDAVDNLEYAIWETMDFGPFTSGSNPGDGYNRSAVDAWEANHSADVSTTADANRWLVITMFSPDDNNCFLGGNKSSPCEQEFIYNGPGRPQSTVPEPGTMGLLATGLVGMMGAGLRRRKNRK